MMRRMALHGITHNHWAVKGSPLLESFFNFPLRQDRNLKYRAQVDRQID